MPTQTRVNEAVNHVINTFTGKRTSYHGHDLGECTVPAKELVDAIAGSIVAPSTGTGRADGYYHNFPAPLDEFFDRQAYQQGRAYPRGTLLIWNSPHIAIVLSCDGSNTVQVFEQNADPNGSPCKTADRKVNTASHTCIGALVPIITPEPAPEPVPTPVPVPPVIVHPYAIQIIDPKQVTVKAGTHRWGLNYDNYKAIEANPEATLASDTVITVQALLTHNLGSQYYLENPDVASGYNVLDCTDYTPPPPPKTTPSAPLPFPNDTEPYGVIKKLRGYSSSNNAINQVNWGGVYVKPGTYMVYNRKVDIGGNLLAVNVTVVQGKAGSWIRVGDNVADTPEQVAAKIAEARAPQITTTSSDPTPAPVAPPVEKPLETEATIRNSFMYLQDSMRPIEFEVVNNVLLTDRIHGGSALNVKAGTVVKIHGTFEQGGRFWALVKLARDRDSYCFYGFPVNSRTDFRPSLDDIFDFSTHIKYGFELFVDNLYKTIDGIFSVTRRK